jgi:hypothetical protein
VPAFFPRAVTLRLGVDIKGVVVAGDTCGAGSTASGHIRSFKRVALHDSHLVHPCLLVRVTTIQPRALHATEKMRLTQNYFTNRQIEPKHRRTP